MSKRKRSAAQNSSIASFKRIRTGLSRKQTSSVRRIAKKSMLSLSESINQVFIVENDQLYHNKSAYKINLLATKQGLVDDNTANSVGTRKGDEIILKNINIRFWLSNKEDRPNVMYKGYLFWYDSAKTDPTTFDPIVWFTQTNKMLDRINTEQISVLDSFIVRSGNSYVPTENEHSYLATLNKSWKQKKIKYKEGTGSTKFKDLGFVVVCYDAWGTLQTDNIASMAYNIKLSFKDP